MIGLYIHIPFCRKKCPYCSFYSLEDFSKEIVESYLADCLREIKSYDRSFDTIYIGGGTPSIIDASVLAKFIEELPKGAKEFTIEANPESVTDDFISVLKGTGVNRVSLGVQSFNDDVLKLLGRVHNSSVAYKAVERLKKIEVDINLDLIFDIPDVDSSIVFKSLSEVINLEPSHVSAYSYTSSDTGYLEGFDDDETQFLEVEERLNSAKIFKYETSNFSKVGKESKHNSIYWNMNEYIGIGAASHSMIYEDGQRVRYSRPLLLDFFGKCDIYEKLSNSVAFRESLILGLRLKSGIRLSDIEARFGATEDSLKLEIERLISVGLLKWEKGKVKATERGALVLEHVSSSLL